MFSGGRLKLFVSLCLTFASSQYSYVIKDSYPNLTDLVMFPSRRSLGLEIPANVIAKNFSIDIEKLDIQKFRRNQNAFRKQIMGEINDEDLFTNHTKRQNNDTRRFAIPYFGFVTYGTFRQGIAMMTRTKVADIMLQTIYMARHKILALERLRFKKETTAYRLAFLYGKLKILHRYMMRILTTMRKNRDNIKNINGKTQKELGNYSWQSVNPMLILHHKAAKIHRDFVYMFWAYVRLYERHCKLFGIENIISTTRKKKKLI